MPRQEPLSSIDLEDMIGATGGGNPFTSAWNGAKKLGHKVVDAASAGVDYVKQHPDILLQTSRLL